MYLRYTSAALAHTPSAAMTNVAQKANWPHSEMELVRIAASRLGWKRDVGNKKKNWIADTSVSDLTREPLNSSTSCLSLNIVPSARHNSVKGEESGRPDRNVSSQISNASSPTQRAASSSPGEENAVVIPVRKFLTGSQSGSSTGSEARKQIQELRNEVARLQTTEESRCGNGSSTTTSMTASACTLGNRAEPHVELTRNARRVMELEELRNVRELNRRKTKTFGTLIPPETTTPSGPGTPAEANASLADRPLSRN